GRRSGSSRRSRGNDGLGHLGLRLVLGGVGVATGERSERHNDGCAGDRSRPKNFPDWFHQESLVHGRSPIERSPWPPMWSLFLRAAILPGNATPRSAVRGAPPGPNLRSAKPAHHVAHALRQRTLGARKENPRAAALRDHADLGVDPRSGEDVREVVEERLRNSPADELGPSAANAQDEELVRAA